MQDEEQAAQEQTETEVAQEEKESETENNLRQEIAELRGALDEMRNMVSRAPETGKETKDEPLLPEPKKEDFADDAEYGRWSALTKAMNTIAGKIGELDGRIDSSAQSYEEAEDKKALQSFVKAHPEYANVSKQNEVAKAVRQLLADPNALLEMGYQRLRAQTKTDKKAIVTQPSRTPAGKMVSAGNKPVTQSLASASERIKQVVLQARKGTIPLE